MAKPKRISETDYNEQVAKAYAKKTGKSLTAKDIKALSEVKRDVLAKGLRTHDSVRTEFGIVKKRIKPAVRKGTPVFNPGTGKKEPSKGKPATTKVRLSPSKDLLGALR